MAASERTTRAALADALGGSRRPRGVVMTAPAGAGKTHVIATAAD